MSKKGPSSAGAQTVTQTSNPWAGIDEPLRQAVKDTQGLYNNGKLNLSYYPGQTVANQSPWTAQAQGLLAQRALGGSQLTDSAKNQLQSTINGDYLDITKAPGFQQSLDDIAKTYSTGTAAGRDAAFNRSGAYGGSAYNEVKGMQDKSFADSLNTLAGNQYNNARTQQLLAANQAPQIANNDYVDIGQLQGVGQNQDIYKQSLINSDIDRFNFNQSSPANAIQNYVTMLNGAGGDLKQTQQSTPLYQNNAANTLGMLGGVNSLLGGGWGADASGSGGSSFLGNAAKMAAKAAMK